MILSTTTSSQNNTEPRLEPIENPNSLKLKLVYWLSELFLGKTPTPLKVLFARFPKGLGLSKKLADTEKKFTIDPKLKHLIKTYVATINGCGFCIDMGKASALKESFDSSIFDDLLRFEESNKYSEAEKSALAYADEATRNKHVTDDTFKRLQQHFSEQEIVQITLINALENFYNLTNTPMNISSDELCELWSSN